MKPLKHYQLRIWMSLILFLAVFPASYGEAYKGKANITDYTVASGEWTTGTNWHSGTVPDPGSNNTYNLTFWTDIEYNPGGGWPNPFIWDRTITITIKSGATLTINSDLEIKNNFTFIIEEGGQFIVNGNVTIKNNVDGSIDGSLYITGDLNLGGGSGNIDGTGEIIVDGTITGGDGVIVPGLITDIHRWLIVNNGDWDLNTSWSKTSGGTVPATSAPNYQCVVHIENGYTALLNVDSEITDLDLQAGGTLDIEAGKTLKVTGNVVSSGNLILRSNASGTAGFIYNGTANVSATCERYVTANEYHYVSSPMTLAPASDYNYTSGGYFNPNFYRYNESEPNANWMYGWVQVSTGNLTPGTGYALYTDENHAYDLSGGTLINQNYNVPISNTPTAGGSKSWNLIGNPYPCNVNADAFIEANDDGTVFTGSLYFWDDDGTAGGNYSSTDYLVYTKGGGTTGGPNGGTFNGKIAPLQAFFVQANTGGNLLFSTSMKTVSPGQFLKSSGNLTINDPAMSIIRLSLLNNEGLYNDILIKFVDDADEGIDIYDGLKLKGNSHMAFYTLYKNLPYAIQGFPKENIQELKVGLGMDANINTGYTIALEQTTGMEEHTQIILEDTEKNRFIDLRKANYSFNAFGQIPNRFVLHVFTESQINPGVEYPSNETSVTGIEDAIQINGIEVDALLELYDLSGKKIFVTSVKHGKQLINIPSSKGYYIVKLISKDRVESYKVFLR